MRRFSSQTTKITQLIDSDVGRPITDIASDLFYPELGEDVRQVLRTLGSAEKQVATRDGRWFTARILPYRTLENKVDGVAITFVDITVSKTLEAELRKCASRFGKTHRGTRREAGSGRERLQAEIDAAIGTRGILWVMTPSLARALRSPQHSVRRRARSDRYTLVFDGHG